MKKIFGIIKTILNIFITIMILLFVVVVCMQRFSDNELSFLNYRMFTVISGSMVPRYNVGDVLISKEVEHSKIKEGDVITYLGKEGQFKNKVVTHEVVEIEIDSEGKYYFHTKGIANPMEDPIVECDQVYGVIIKKLYILSFIYSMVATKTGMFIFVIIPIFYIIGSEFLGYLLDKEEEKREKRRKTKKKISKEE